MAFKNPSGSFVHAAHYASLLIQVCEHLFPGSKIFALSQDQRRIVNNETRILLLQAGWVVDSKEFAEQFSIAQSGGQEAAPETLLGQIAGPSQPPNPGAGPSTGPGPYL